MISTRGRYALRVMIDIATNQEDGYVPMKDVAQRQNLSLKYLEQILPALTKNGLVKGVQGKGGGYRLTRHPEEYVISEILRLTDTHAILQKIKEHSLVQDRLLLDLLDLIQNILALEISAVGRDRPDRSSELILSQTDRALLRIIPAVILIPVSIRGRIFFSLHGKLIRHQVQKRGLAGTITAVQYRDPVKYKLHPFSSAENMIRIDIGAGKFPAA